MRELSQQYTDPLDLVWLEVANQLGMQVRRDSDVFASWDGAGVLKIGVAASLDPDDSLAQMILHEVCHWLVEGEEAREMEDWGLEYGRPEHEPHEHATLRLQAALAAPFQLRTMFAATTDYRSYYDSLPDDPLAGDSADPAVALAQAGWARSQREPVKTILESAFQRTREIANLVAPIAEANSVWRLDR